MGCGDPTSAYTFNFFRTSEPGRPSINFLEQFSLQPGQSFDYVFGTFKPKAGGVAAGSYTFFDSGLDLTIEGLDANGNVLQGGFDLASTCPSQSVSCAFTRTALAATVPEPSSYGLMALGLVFMGGVAARRRTR